MRNVVLAVLGCVLLLTATKLTTPSQIGAMKTVPPHRATLLVAALGRKEQAADLAWLRLVQMTGDARYIASRYPDLEDWMSLIVELHPRLFGPFYFGVTLLLGDPTRRDKVDELLAIAETRAPEEFEFPLERGVIAYFGRFDAARAAEHLERASTKRNAPEFVGQLGKTLRERGVTCAAMAEDAASVSQGGAALGDRRLACAKHRIEAASAAARLNEDPDDSIAALVERGHLPRDALLPGVCWELTAGTATARRCD
jgi:hypothetical protein